MNVHLLVLCTCPDDATARRLAASAIDARLAACVNIVPGLTSVFRWQGEIEHDDEVLLLLKSRRDRYAQLEALLVEAHPYELPEVVAVSLEQGLAGYLAWLDATLDGEE
ncbi:MAG: divalent-cation tolerance protein CutA [Gammaproteobacteria bacterium]|nr:divalent-cation tolerance protein CutA [Gammaproteobacteria bacterium]